MFSTREALDALRRANPQGHISEERVRRALRTGRISPPSTVAGRFVWSRQDLVALAEALDVQPPVLALTREEGLDGAS